VFDIRVMASIVYLVDSCVDPQSHSLDSLFGVLLLPISVT